MDKVRKFGQNSKRLFNRLTKREEDKIADINFRTCVNWEYLTISWHIKDVSECPMNTGEYHESPSFCIGFCNEFKWTLRIYPKGRSVKEKVGLFLCKISPEEARICVEYNMYVELISESTRDWKQNETHFLSNHSKTSTQTISSEKVGSKEWGSEDVFPSNNLFRNKSAHITCHLKIVYVDEDGSAGNCVAESSTSLRNDFKEMYKTGRFSDVVLQVGKEHQPFPAHKSILAARSKYFAAMFVHDLVESRSGVIDAEDVEPSTMSDTLQYIYTGKIDGLTVDKAISLFSAADKYSLEGLQKLCVGVMLSKLSVENVCQIAVLADMHSVPKLKTATNYIFRKFKHEILQTKEWNNLIYEKPKLASDIIHAITFDL